ncbi:DUF4349 domain-containing protein [Sphingomicrobium flavum]|uniref:DUF4349 domain-containing protein n=1 Tax=Sphingomicrobium flavum TaxID=1229164 RepID=UPI0021AE2D6E|nr:DUF4349 domain-containing protein [Sphingomicrobium flavum]
MNRKLLWAIPLTAFAIASCGQAPRYDESEDLQTYDASEEAMADAVAPPAPMSMPAERSDAPGVNVTAAPGVAFDYRYAFRLPANQISPVQEAHAAKCEELGIDKCRIIGMRYQVRGEDKISAMLALRLDPVAARSFGKDATDAVINAEGMLVDQIITGTDVGSRIDQATRSESRLRADLRRLEQQLGAMDEDDRTRGELVARIDDINRQIRSLETGRDQNREALAGTPMVFNYGSGEVIPGFYKDSPIRDALSESWWGFQQVIAFLIILAGFLIPIIGLVWLIMAGNRRFGWWKQKDDFSTVRPTPTEE